MMILAEIQWRAWRKEQERWRKLYDEEMSRYLTEIKPSWQVLNEAGASAPNPAKSLWRNLLGSLSRHGLWRG